MQNSDLEARLNARFDPLMADLAERAAVAERFVDKDLYRILVSTLWVNVVLDPADAGLQEAHLEPLHNVLNRHIAGILGEQESLTSCFRYLNGKAGEHAMKAARLTPNHREMLLYFASMILDPDGHRRWMDALRDRPSH
jgi:hypothetical protein